jgi:hypothetical protein
MRQVTLVGPPAFIQDLACRSEVRPTRLSQHLMGRFLNSDLRVPVSKELQAELLNGTVVNPNRL